MKQLRPQRNLTLAKTPRTTLNWNNISAMRKTLLVFAIVLVGTGAVTAKDTIHKFKKVQLTDQFWAEGATTGDFNHDGKMDIASGPFWYEGPDFKKRHEYAPANVSFKKKKADGSEEI